MASAIESSQALQRAMEHARQGRLAEARQLCEGVLVAEPANSGALSCLGEVLLAMRRPEEALACFERLVQARVTPDPGDDVHARRDAAGLVRVRENQRS